nr:hypothetical protein Iba_chr06eCG7500 [Ipomoea batatas]
MEKDAMDFLDSTDFFRGWASKVSRINTPTHPAKGGSGAYKKGTSLASAGMTHEFGDYDIAMYLAQYCMEVLSGEKHGYLCRFAWKMLVLVPPVERNIWLFNFLSPQQQQRLTVKSLEVLAKGANPRKNHTDLTGEGDRGPPAAQKTRTSIMEVPLQKGPTKEESDRDLHREKGDLKGLVCDETYLHQAKQSIP